ncbi:iron ABC transporter permease [Litoribacter ruber]|uniref:Iron ABC transporter permease n=1 Tax=Litoribacter ruber TaxID=702568 RepID=A0AAP2G403_9BACT|nr:MULTISPECIES: iron ABC transporter permease [Litoribacter]MBS9523551.1 iron ABC transporter permease [Litoribacter alkaliphilus]MBT0812032.1 iron ABC transporter permease [Litoribacter ruber]
MDIAKQNYYWWNKWSGAAVIILMVIAVPVFTIFFKIFEPPGNSWRHLSENLLAGYFLDTILLLLGVAFFTFLIGVTSAWLVSNYDFPGRRYFEWLLILPLGFPGYIMAYTYTGMLDYAGPIQSFLRNSLDIHITGSLLDIMNLPGAVFILSITLFPYVFVISRSSFLQQSKTLQEASALLGSSRWRTFQKVALPLARPAIVGGIALASMEVLNDYGTVKYFGVNTFTTGIFRAWFSMGDATTAIYLSAILMLFVFTILYLESLQRGNRQFGNANSLTKPLERVQINWQKKAVFTTFCTMLFLISFLIPLIQIIYWVLLTYEKVINYDFFLLIFRSFSLAAGTGIAVVILAVVLLYALRLSPFKWMKNVTKIATLGYAIPGAVIAVGIMVPLLGFDKWVTGIISPDNVRLLLSGTLFGLVFAYIVRFMAVGYNPIDSGFQKIGIHINEASRLLGKGSTKTLWKIDLPLIKPSLFSGILLVFVDVLKELPLTLILRPFNYHTLATKAFDMATNEMIAESANAALIIILTGIIPIIFLNRMIRRKEA